MPNCILIEKLGNGTFYCAVHIIDRTVVTGNNINIVVLLDFKKSQYENHEPHNEARRLKYQRNVFSDIEPQ